MNFLLDRKRILLHIGNRVNSSILLFFLLFFGIIFISGCATWQKEDEATTYNQLIVKVSLAGNISNQAKYYVVLSDSNDLNLPNLSLSPYFFGPGEWYDEESINIGDLRDVDYYYENYFSSWDDFIVLESGSFYLTKGPFPSSADADTHYSFSRVFVDTHAVISENIITLSFDFDNLNREITDIYLNIFTVDTLASGRVLSDCLNSNEYLENIVGARKTGDDSADSHIPAALDIRSWELEIN